jgi:hypothetical protein
MHTPIVIAKILNNDESFVNINNLVNYIRGLERLFGYLSTNTSMH